MSIILSILEGIVACFVILITLVVGIADGAVNLACLYEKEVRERVVELGMITEKKLKRNSLLFSLWIPVFVAFVLVSVYAVNGARGFWDGFWQMLIIVMIEGLFDRLFIDWYWVGKTKAWDIPETDDLKPYIYGKNLVLKWIYTLVGYPVLVACLAALMANLIK